MAFDLSSLLLDPNFQFGISALSGNDRSLQPLARALQQYQAMSRMTEEQANREEYLRMHREENDLRKAQHEATLRAMRAKSAAVKASLADKLNPPPGIPPTVNVGGDRPLAFQPDEPTLPGGGWDMPTGYESNQMRVFKAIDELANADPDSAMGMAKDVYSGDIPVQGMPGKPKRAPTLRDFMLPGGEQQTQQWDEQAGQWNPVGQPVPRWKPAQPRTTTSSGGTGGGRGAQPKKLTAEMERTREEIQAARLAVEQVAKSGLDPRVLAQSNPGFKATLEKANKRKPGGDEIWSNYMVQQAQKMKQEEQLRKQRAEALRKQMGM